MNILLVGSGGREHALAWALSASDLCDTLYCAPGNAGIESCATLVDLKDTDVDGLVQFAIDNAINLVVIGPEAPLVAGLSDALRAKGIDVFGPSQAAAQLEGSKGFMKDLCKEFDIPTAAYERFTDIEKAEAYIRDMGAPIVIKADGLAAGKGVIVAMELDEALEAARDMLSGNAFGDSGSSIVVEEFMDGEELSFFALADGHGILPLTSAQDHKRAFDGDKGPNTGGMGAYSPARLMSQDLHDKIMTRIIEPTVRGMKERGMPYTGVLYAGLMIVNGEPSLIEYNARFGDPECQVLMMRLQADLAEILQAGAQGRLSEIADKVHWSEDVAMCVVMATNGYPQSYPKNTPINGLDEANNSEGVVVFHAGTAKDGDQIVSIGGRVLGVTAKGASVAEAQKRAYAAVDKIDWPDGFCRRDIGWRAL